MSTVPKYAALPDLDAAPDIYETPDLTDDASTVPASTLPRSESPASSYGEIENRPTGISRRRLDPDEARSHFLPQDPNSADSEFSGRIKSKRKSYKESAKRSRLIGADSHGAENVNDEDEEGLEQKLARLRREVAEVKADFDRRTSQDREHTQATTKVAKEELDTLGEVLDSVNLQGSRSGDATATRLVQRLATAASDRPIPTDATRALNGLAAQSEPMYKLSYAPEYDQQHSLAKIADFDTRLTLLETVLGVDTIAFPTQASSQDKSVLPTLEKLDNQVSVLSASTESNLDSANRRVRQLTQDTQRLTEARKSAKAAQEDLNNSRNTSRPSTAPQLENGAHGLSVVDDPEQISKINALYGTLPTIQSLSPLLPSLLDRLRSLRSVHADAAASNQSLAQVESRQEAMAEDIRNWKAGLENIERIIEQEQKTMSGNMSAVEGWVRELEDRMQGNSSVLTKSAQQ